MSGLLDLPVVAKVFCFEEKTRAKLPPVLELVLVKAKGWKVVPLNRADEALPKSGMVRAPVIMSDSLAARRLVGA